MPENNPQAATGWRRDGEIVISEDGRNAKQHAKNTKP